MDITVMERLAQRKRQIDDIRKRDTIEHYRELSEAKAKGVKVSWSAAGLLSPLLDALGILPCGPENYAALCTWRQLAGKFNAAAEARGIPPDLCSYGRCIMGMMWEQDGPFGALPAPDIVISDAGECDAHAKMWQVPAHYYNVPSFLSDGSFILDGSPTQGDLEYRVSELRRLVSFCEEHLGVKLDYDRFKENMRIEGEVRTLLHEIQTLRKEVPCPRSTRDLMAGIFYIAVLPHTKQALNYFKLVAEDCRDRVEHKIGAIDNERFRLYWDNIPIWFWLEFYDYFHEHGAVFASDCYSTTMFNGYYWRGGRFDLERPFESLALRNLYTQVCSGVEPSIEWYARLIGDWHCDGAVFFVNRSCKVVTSGRRDKVEMLKSRFGIPVMHFEGEMANPHSVDKAEVMERAKALLESLEARAAGPKAR